MAGGRIPEETINELRDRVSIVDVVSNYVSLKKAGRNWLGLCPFHSEKTPSFTVSEERGLFHCFGCGAGGSVFNFVMQQERVEFREAVEMIAQRVGFQLPAPDADERAANERERLIRLNNWAAKRFSEALWTRGGETARAYLEKRGVSEQIARDFGLGYAPASADLISRPLASRRDALTAAMRLGLVAYGDGSRVYDRFRARLMFPIVDARGAIIAFGGRSLGDAQPKYLNSPESPLFRKGEVLYALPKAREEMRTQGEAIVVEGYLDALALIQFGIRNAVATLGTALTPMHLKVLSRLAPRIVVFFDGDNAGRKAATRGVEVCAATEGSGIWAQGAFLPDGEDPDSYIRKYGEQAVRDLLKTAAPLTEFFLDQLQRIAARGPRERAAAADEAVRVIRLVSDPLVRDSLIRDAARRIGLSEEALQDKLRREPRRSPAMPATETVRPEPLEPRAEVGLLESMAVDGEIAITVERRGVIDRFRNPILADCARDLVSAWTQKIDVVGVIERMPNFIAAKLSQASIDSENQDAGQRKKAAEDCIRRIEAEAEKPVQEAARREVAEASAAGDADRERELLRQAQERIRAHKAR